MYIHTKTILMINTILDARSTLLPYAVAVNPWFVSRLSILLLIVARFCGGWYIAMLIDWVSPMKLNLFSHSLVFIDLRKHQKGTHCQRMQIPIFCFSHTFPKSPLRLPTYHARIASDYPRATQNRSHIYQPL